MGFGRTLPPLSLYGQGKLNEGTSSTSPAVSPPLFVGTEKLPCVYPSKRTLNEINKFRLNWQLPSIAIILFLMSLPVGVEEDLACAGVAWGVARRPVPTQRSD